MEEQVVQHNATWVLVALVTVNMIGGVFNGYIAYLTTANKTKSEKETVELELARQTLEKEVIECKEEREKDRLYYNGRISHLEGVVQQIIKKIGKETDEDVT